jgi:stage II sporulation protein D
VAALVVTGAASAMMAAAPGTTTTTTTTATTTTTTTTTETTTTSTAPATLVFSGHGFGHGVGMSQWGAFGYALHGWKYPAILAHYYSGTTLGLRGPSVVRVLLDDSVKKIALSSAATWQVRDATGTSAPLPAGQVVVKLPYRVDGARLVPPLTFSGSAAAPVEVSGNPYRGSIVVSKVGPTLDVVDAVRLESYLKGVVAAEMPPGWPLQALEAQAVAARSFALASLTPASAAAPFDLYSDSRSQVYAGIAGETPQTNRAVTATAGKVVLYDGQVALAYFSSSSGGRTESQLDANGLPVPYLKSVPDPYDTLSPYHDWGPVLVPAAKAAKELGVQGRLLDLMTSTGPTGRVATATAVGSGGEVPLLGTDVRDDLGLRSTWFTVGWLELDPPSGPVADGGSASVQGVVRGLSGVALEARTAGGAWQTVSTVKPDAAGAFSVVVHPRTTTSYRLSAGLVNAGLAKVVVQPAVTSTSTVP